MCPSVQRILPVCWQHSQAACVLHTGLPGSFAFTVHAFLCCWLHPSCNQCGHSPLQVREVCLQVPLGPHIERL